MNLSKSHLQRLYQGFLNTPLLWNSNPVLGLKQLQFQNYDTFLFKRSLEKKLRLGLLAEQFVFNQLEQLENCRILAENLQIQKEKQTLGELDALIEFDKGSIHLEIVYKFYLYDATLGTSEIEQWIGPNRNDSLIEKITKLKDKQLPLLYSSNCESALNELDLNNQSFQQNVLFKAQLFTPYLKPANFNQLNNACVCGFYMNKAQLNDFNTCKFHIPPKLDWFLNTEHSVNWLNFESFKTEVEVFLEQSKSPLIWIKKTDDTLLKSFLVWW
ncbi:DUF1853 family protein [Psychroserpens ponticola]|uniref:DUF1853 family protein n=1 Tax=Psychroserpens ponticola TaxID=2932268 RepID=A0ABY7S1F8_9FLAO|nr:DUF1853 family protein [Psychroserpens ponticola]WCO03233.1 DUF1853 family protein [Psychroserpens ponticola]